MTGSSIDTLLSESQPGVAMLPVVPGLVLVASDLHMGAGLDAITARFHRGENFLHGAAFEELLRGQVDSGANDPLLVLAGDIFDFLRIADVPVTDHDVEGWSHTLAELGVAREPDELRLVGSKEQRFGLGTEDFKCVWKLLHIARGHPAFFRGIGAWIAAGGWVVFIRGNHDAELFWPLVRAAIRREVALAVPGAPVDERLWFAMGGLRVGNVYIEHGHQFESVTAIKGEPVLPNGRELNLPLGSFVNRYIINSLERIDPFLDNQKPVQRALHAILRRHPLQIFSIIWHGGPFLRRAMRRYWLRDALAFAVFFVTLTLPLLTAALLLGVLLWPPLGDFLQHVLGRGRAPLAILGAAAPWLSGLLREVWPRRRPRVGEDHVAEALHRVLTRISFEPTHGVVYGVLGHTHRPDVQCLPAIGSSKSIYVNCGTWIPCWEERRPDLAGRVVLSFLRFRATALGSYTHEHLECLDDHGTTRPSTMLAPHGRGRMGGRLSAREYSTVRAFAEVFIEGDREVLTAEQVADNVNAHITRLRTKRIGSLHLALFLVEYLVPLMAFRGPFSRLSHGERRELMARYLASPGAGTLLRSLAKIRSLFIAGYYGDVRVYESLRFLQVADRARNQPPNPPLEPRPQPSITVEPPRYGEHVLHTDLCVVGSGAGGAVIAALAAQAGRRVLLLEEGPFLPATALTHDEWSMSAKLYKESGLQSTVDLGMTILQGQVLGGTTVINNHICFQLLADADTFPDSGSRVLGAWDRFGARLDRDALTESYRRVASRIGVARMPAEAVGTNGHVLLQGWSELVAQGGGSATFPSGTFKKNYERCVACGYCNFGCPYGRKLSMLETYVAAAAAAGARVIAECHVTQILRSGHRATGVHARLSDGREIAIRAQQTVIACGTIGSSVLLLKSGIRRNVGTRLSFNVASPVYARLSHPLDAFDGDQMSTYVDSGTYLLESAFNPPMAFAAALPGWFGVHFDRMRAYNRFACAGVVVPTAPTGRVKRFPPLRNLLGPVAWRMQERDFETLRDGIVSAAAVFLAAGADEVLPATFGDSSLSRSEFVVKDKVQMARLGAAVRVLLQRPADVMLNSSHPQGGNPMSDDPRRGAVSSGCAVHGVQDLFVCDASVFPTSIRINPQLTVMAIADYAWHGAISR